MSKACGVRLGLILACAVAGGVGWAGKAAPKLQTYTGKVRPLVDVLAKADVKLDADAAPHWLALVTEDGKVYPLVKDGGARLFFKDKALLDRPMQLTGRLVGGAMLQVAFVNSLRKGARHEVFYWCDICAIRRGEKEQECECCGGPMVLKEEPVK